MQQHSARREQRSRGTKPFQRSCRALPKQLPMMACWINEARNREDHIQCRPPKPYIICKTQWQHKNADSQLYPAGTLNTVIWVVIQMTHETMVWPRNPSCPCESKCNIFCYAAWIAKASPKLSFLHVLSHILEKLCPFRNSALSKMNLALALSKMNPLCQYQHMFKTACPQSMFIENKEFSQLAFPTLYIIMES